MAGPRYFVTQESPKGFSHFPNVAVSVLSEPALLARQVVLYQGENETLARGIAENLIRGRLSSYFTDRGNVHVVRRIYDSGRSTDLTESFDLNCKDPIGDLLNMPGVDGRPDTMNFFAAFSPQEMQYIESLRASRSTRRAATEPMGT